MNKGVDHECGFVLAPKGMTEQKNHIPEAYLTKLSKKVKHQAQKKLHLKKEVCILLPYESTPQYSLVVE